LFFNNLGLCHIESVVSQLSPFSLHSTFSPLWTQFQAFLDTKLDTKSGQRDDKIKSIRMKAVFGVHSPPPGHFEPW
jgi:hypothetical protein